MAGGRGRRRRQAAKSYDEGHQNETRWVNAIQIPLPPQCGGSGRCCGSSLSSLHRTESSPVLELSGFQSQTRTIFARIIERNGNNERGNTDETAKGDGNNTINRDCWRVEHLVSVIVNEIFLREEAAVATREANCKTKNNINKDTKTPPASVEVESSQSLLELGSVWVLDPASSDRPQNKPVWKRLLKEELDEKKKEDDDGMLNTDSLFWFDDTMTLRVHSRPSRYPMAQHFRMALEQQQQQQQKDITSNGKRSEKNSCSSTIHGGIVYERAVGADLTIEDTVAFAVLNKPVGMPSHSTVDNAVENLLYQYQRHRNLGYASLPQRLDTETSGLVLVTTLPQFATYFSKLLEQKSTTNHTSPSLLSLPSSFPSLSTPPSIKKQYRCLVAFPNGSSEEIRDSIQENYIRSGMIVEHFVDANSNAPKTFVSASVFHKIDNPITKSTSTSSEKSSAHSAGSTHKWQLCKLRILSMSNPIPTPIQQHQSSSGEVSSSKDILCCSEVEIELLTGRTHQIRGQLLALGCPIFGDPLYGKALANTNTNAPPTPPTPKNWRDRSALRMALQCCQLSFTLDAASVGRQGQAPSPPVRGSNSSKNNHHHRRNRRVDSSEDRNSDAPDLVAFVNCPRQFEFRLDSAWWRVG
jgi:23S rRNA-/tRNA-specific pseudouridylate synthase